MIKFYFDGEQVQLKLFAMDQLELENSNGDYFIYSS